MVQTLKCINLLPLQSVDEKEDEILMNLSKQDPFKTLTWVWAYMIENEQWWQQECNANAMFELSIIDAIK